MSKISEHIINSVGLLGDIVIEVGSTTRRATQVRFRLELAQGDSGLDPAGWAFRDDDSIVNQITNSMHSRRFGQRVVSYLTAFVLSNMFDACAICALFDGAYTNVKISVRSALPVRNETPLRRSGRFGPVN